MESMVVDEVSFSEWTALPLAKTYLSPIAVYTVKYNTGGRIDVLSALVRIQNVSPTSLKIRLHNPKSDFFDGNRAVHCVVVEEGSWEMPDGRKIEAKKYLSIVTDKQHSWVGEQQTYTDSYANPVVMGQVMSYNDPNWSVFWSRDSNKANSIFTGKHSGEDTTTTRADETADYIAIEAGHAASVGIEIETARGAHLCLIVLSRELVISGPDGHKLRVACVPVRR
jgi:hypothetical protein